MSNGSLAKRYTRALFSISEEANAVEQFNSELQSLIEVLHLNNNELLRTLTVPVFKIEERKQVAQVVLGKMGLHQMVQNFVQLLLDKDRLVLIDEISKIFQLLADEKAGRVRATVQTATVISDEEQSEIRNTLASSVQINPEQLLIEFSVTPELIGGILAKVGDRTYDATLRTQLLDMKQTLLST